MVSLLSSLTRSLRTLTASFLFAAIIVHVTLFGRRGSGVNPLFTFGYNSNTGQYIGLDGVVDESLVLEAMEERISLGIERMRNYLAAVQSGAGNLADLQSAAIVEIRNMNIQLYALAKGGFPAMGIQDYFAASKIVQSELTYFANFTSEISAGNLSAAQIEARLQQYGKHAWASYWAGKNAAMKIAGATHESREANDDEGTCDDCRGYERQGIKPLGFYPAPGEGSVCMGNCRCKKIYYIEQDGKFVRMAA